MGPVSDPMLPGPIVLAVASDALVLLVGPAGAGKTTFAARHFRPGEVVSSDLLRGRVSGDPADQSATDRAFRALHRVVGDRSRRGLVTVVDATNLLYPSRASLLDISSGWRRPAVAVAFDVSIGQCLAWNARRPGRFVVESVLRRQHRLMDRALQHLPREGFESIVVVRTPREIDRLTIQRTG